MPLLPCAWNIAGLKRARQGTKLTSSGESNKPTTICKVTMPKILTWNTLKALRERAAFVKAIEFDACALQECEADVLREEMTSLSVPSAKLPHKHVALLSPHEVYDFEVHPEYSNSIGGVVDAPVPFYFVSLWTWNNSGKKGYGKPFFSSYPAMANKMVSYFFERRQGLPFVVAGDFNMSTGYISPAANEAIKLCAENIERWKSELGIVSAYHRYTGDELGLERHKTWHVTDRQAAKGQIPHHIDYIFGPSEAEVSLCRMGGRWGSDHSQLIAEIEFPH